MADQKIYPEIFERYSESIVLDPKIMKQWRSAGFALLKSVISMEEIAQAKAAVEELIRNRPQQITEDFGGFSFPFDSDVLNKLVLHPTILSIAREALQGDVLLSQGEAWAKKQQPKSKLGNQDQRMHMDYPNHTLTHPPAWDEPNVIAMIIYFDDVEECGGATAVVSKEGNNDPLYVPPYINMPGVGRHPWLNDRETTEVQQIVLRILFLPQIRLP